MDHESNSEVHDLVELLNSWRIPNDTRQGVDHLPDWVAGEWDEHFTVTPRPSSPAAIMVARDGLREAVSGRTTAVVDRLLGELPPRLSLGDDASLHSAPAVDGDAASTVVWLVFRLAAAGRLHRLRTCPDCGWAFYDTTKNAQRVWCAMTSADGGRGCGSIAKTRAYRARRRAAAPAN